MPTKDFRRCNVPRMRLDLFGQKKLHEALTEAGYDVSLRTVRRWVEGEASPNGAWQRAILEVLDMQKEAAPPEWAKRLEDKLDAVAERQRIIANETLSRAMAVLAPESQLDEARRLNERLEALLRLRAEASPEESEAAGPAEAGPQEPRDE